MTELLSRIWHLFSEPTAQETLQMVRNQNHRNGGAVGVNMVHTVCQVLRWS